MIKTVSFIFLLTILSTSLFAQGRFKVRQDQYIQIGYERPFNTSLTFGISESNNPQENISNNNGAMAIEYWKSGLNFWRPWPNWNAENFFFFIGNTGRVGVGMYPDPNDWTNILQVKGKVISHGYNTWSDERLKENVSPLDNALQKVQKLNAYSYNYKIDTDLFKQDFSNLDDLDEIKKKSISENSHHLHEDFKKDKRFGYLAQDLEEIVPEVVNTDTKGYKSVNYSDLIPLALEAIKEQQEQIETLKAELQNLKVLNQYANYPKDLGIIASLYPNDPNPFDQKTSIKYNIESDFNKAELVIFDFWGDIKDKHQITSKGEATYVFSTGNLVSGKYHYSLIVNGVVVDTRIMIIMK